METLNEKQFIQMLINELEDVLIWVSSKETFSSRDRSNWARLEESLHGLMEELLTIRNLNGGSYADPSGENFTDLLKQLEQLKGE